MTPSIFSHENLGTGRMHGWGPGSPMSGALARLGENPGNFGWTAGGVPPGLGTGSSAATRLVPEGKGKAACGAKSKVGGGVIEGEEPNYVEGCGCGGECGDGGGASEAASAFGSRPLGLLAERGPGNRGMAVLSPRQPFAWSFEPALATGARVETAAAPPAAAAVEEDWMPAYAPGTDPDDCMGDCIPEGKRAEWEATYPGICDGGWLYCHRLGDHCIWYWWCPKKGQAYSVGSAECPEEENGAIIHEESPELDASTGATTVIPNPFGDQEAHCRVVVGAKTAFGLAPVYHTFIAFYADDDALTWFEGQPDLASGGLFGEIRVADHSTPLPSGPTVQVLPHAGIYPHAPNLFPSEAECDSIKACFYSELARINGKLLVYDALKRNSNSVVYSMLRNCGLPILHPDVSPIPGWGERI